METIRTKEEIYHMLNYVLDPEDIKDESLIAHWTDVLFQLHVIRQKFPRPTKALLEINNEVHATRKMHINSNVLNIDSNHNIKWIENNKPDISVYGDVTIENCEKDLNVIGNVNAEILNITGDLKSDTICNFGNLTIYCNKLNVDDLRASGHITIYSKENIMSDFYSDNANINGDIKTTFLNTNILTTSGNINATSINYEKPEVTQVDLNKP